MQEHTESVLHLPDLDKELGIVERSLHGSDVRIPGKTHLSAVLFANNPWEDRDLKKKLKRIQDERSRREKALDWSQRWFFVNQVFDSDYTLRFTKKRHYVNEVRHWQSRYAGYVTPNQKEELLIGNAKHSKRQGGKVTEKSIPSEGGKATSDLKLPAIGVSNLGIFATTSSMEKLNRRVRNKSLMTRTWDGHMTLADSMPNLRKAPPEELTASLSAAGKHSTESLMSCQGSDTCRSNAHKTQDVIKESTLECGFPVISNHDEETKQLHKAISLPNIYAPRQRVLSTELKEATSLRRDELSGSTDSDVITKVSSTYEQPKQDPVLCNPDVILRITRTLPMSLLIKANQNVNKVVNAQKQKMLARARKASQKVMKADPRFKNLEASLVKGNDCPVDGDMLDETLYCATTE